MLEYVVCEIAGKQYKIIPSIPIEVDWLGDKNELEVPVLLLSEDGNIKIGTPFLDRKIKLECIETIKRKKIRVAKFHAKANYRKMIGSRKKMTKVLFSVKK